MAQSVRRAVTAAPWLIVGVTGLTYQLASPSLITSTNGFALRRNKTVGKPWELGGKTNMDAIETR